MKDIMIDLETLGNGPDAVVVSIGACFFDIENKEIGDKFYHVLNIQDQVNCGRVIDESTLKWWMKQNAEARKVFDLISTMPFNEAILEEFIVFYCSQSRSQDDKKVMPKVWGNGSTFDITIMESLYRTYDRKAPWGYNKARDLRTFKEYVAKGADIINNDTKHNALDDAVSQALYVMEHVK